MIHILTLKIGDKYSSQYINNLYRGIKKNTTVDFKMYCYTEDPKDIVDDVEIIELTNPNLLKLQWHKIQFHSKNFAGIKNEERCLILDIDWIITGNLDDILSFDIKSGSFGCFERWWSNRLEWCSINGGFQMYRMGDTEYLHRIFFADPEYWQERFIKLGEAEPPVNGEQNFIDLIIGPERYWFPKQWFAKYHEPEMEKIRKNWKKRVSPNPLLIHDEWDDEIKMIHFSNAENIIENSSESWIEDFWPV